MTLIPTSSRPYDEPCSLRVDFWTEMPREGASLGAQTMPDNCQFLQGENVVLSGKETIEDMSTIRGMYHR